MKIIARFEGLADYGQFAWPDEWPLPNVGDVVAVTRPEQARDQWGALNVKGIMWVPKGDEQSAEPVIYLSLGTRAQDARIFESPAVSGKSNHPSTRV